VCFCVVYLLLPMSHFLYVSVSLPYFLLFLFLPAGLQVHPGKGRGSSFPCAAVGVCAMEGARLSEPTLMPCLAARVASRPP
jgi:hypothetical protein